MAVKTSEASSAHGFCPATAPNQWTSTSQTDADLQRGDRLEASGSCDSPWPFLALFFQRPAVRMEASGSGEAGDAVAALGNHAGGHSRCAPRASARSSALCPVAAGPALVEGEQDGGRDDQCGIGSASTMIMVNASPPRSSTGTRPAAFASARSIADQATPCVRPATDVDVKPRRNISPQRPLAYRADGPATTTRLGPR